MLLQNQKLEASIAAAMLDVLSRLKQINTTSHTCYAAIYLANEFFSIHIRKRGS